MNKCNVTGNSPSIRCRTHISSHRKCVTSCTARTTRPKSFMDTCNWPSRNVRHSWRNGYLTPSLHLSISCLRHMSSRSFETLTHFPTNVKLDRRSWQKPNISSPMISCWQEHHCVPFWRTLALTRLLISPPQVKNNAFHHSTRVSIVQIPFIRTCFIIKW